MLLTITVPFIPLMPHDKVKSGLTFKNYGILSIYGSKINSVLFDKVWLMWVADRTKYPADWLIYLSIDIVHIFTLCLD